jgi:hypothetical protein
VRARFHTLTPSRGQWVCGAAAPITGAIICRQPHRQPHHAQLSFSLPRTLRSARWSFFRTSPPHTTKTTSRRSVLRAGVLVIQADVKDDVLEVGTLVLPCSCALQLVGMSMFVYDYAVQLSTGMYLTEIYDVYKHPFSYAFLTDLKRDEAGVPYEYDRLVADQARFVNHCNINKTFWVIQVSVSLNSTGKGARLHCTTHHTPHLSALLALRHLLTWHGPITDRRIRVHAAALPAAARLPAAPRHGVARYVARAWRAVVDDFPVVPLHNGHVLLHDRHLRHRRNPRAHHHQQGLLVLLHDGRHLPGA